MKAAEESYNECAELLIKAGTDVNMLNKYGEPALIVASFNGHDNCIELFIQARADVNVQNCHRYTALMSAARIGRDTCAELLIKAGGDVNLKNDDGDTALIEAAHGGNDKYMRLLIEVGADVNIHNVQGATALTKAVKGDRVGSKCDELLIKSGGDVNQLSGYINNIRNHDRLKLLFAAGLNIDEAGDRAKRVKDELIPELSSVIHLSHLCRETIRNHLLKLGSHENLFVRVPRLPLPKALQSYLLYDQALYDVAEGTDKDKWDNQKECFHKMVN